MGYQTNGINTGSIPVDFVQRLVKWVQIPYFVETGTAGGESVCSIADMFRKCFTVELKEGIPNRCDAFSNISAYIGQSDKVLPEILTQIPENEFALFWLDAHWDGDGDNPETECPLLNELECIKVHQKAIILIDDARLFLGAVPSPLDPRKWCGIDQIFETLKRLFPSNTMTVMDDYILSYPYEAKDTVFNEWRERFKIRYPDAPERLKKSVLETIDAIKKYIQ